MYVYIYVDIYLCRKSPFAQYVFLTFYLFIYTQFIHICVYVQYEDIKGNRSQIF